MQAFLERNQSSNSPVAVLERMDFFKIVMKFDDIINTYIRGLRIFFKKFLYSNCNFSWRRSFLTDLKDYPKGLLANEVQLELNGTKKRCDTVLYNKDLSAKMIGEYKAPNVEITQAVFDQITRYNMVLKVEYLIVTNGLHHYCCHIDYSTMKYTFLPDIPAYGEL